MEKNGQKNSIALLGGSFNPLHLGHLRLAVEVYEAVRPGRLDFIPCANPAHKNPGDLLPFELRCYLLKAATQKHPFFYVNGLEAERASYSYTADTLREYRRDRPGAKLYFILGAEDYEELDTWKDWRILPELAELLVVARQGAEVESFKAATRRLWPEAREETGLARPAFSMGQGGLTSYLPFPRLDINASLIRERWLAGRCIDYWVPREVTELLAKNSETVRSCWRN